jgi:hypothetical protein
MKLIVNSEILKMSDQEYEQAKAEVKARAKEVHDAARIIAADGKTINKYWLEDVGDTTKNWEKCTIKFRAKDNGRNYMEWVDIKLDDGTLILSTHYHTNDGFDVHTFRNGAWVERFINYSKEDVIAELERQKQEELQQRLKPFSAIDF